MGASICRSVGRLGKHRRWDAVHVRSRRCFDKTDRRGRGLSRGRKWRGRVREPDNGGRVGRRKRTGEGRATVDGKRLVVGSAREVVRDPRPRLDVDVLLILFVRLLESCVYGKVCSGCWGGMQQNRKGRGNGWTGQARLALPHGTGQDRIGWRRAKGGGGACGRVGWVGLDARKGRGREGQARINQEAKGRGQGKTWWPMDLMACQCTFWR